MSGAAFAAVGSLLVLAGVLSILIGVPVAAHDLTPVSGGGDLLNRFGEIAPVLSAGIAAVVAMVVAALLLARRLEPAVAAAELLVLGLAMAACIGGAAGRIGHAVDGGVLTATVACMMGGMAVVAGALVSVLGRE